jgi:hypothetical protein
VAFSADELRGVNTEFQQLSNRLRDELRFVPLERVMATAAGREQPHPNDPNCRAARQAFETVLATIHFMPASQATRTVSIGVAERFFDTAHSDFQDQTGATVFRRMPGDMPDGSTPAGMAAPRPNDEPVDWRPMRDDDHGTAVASLIAARLRPFPATPLVPNSVIVPLHYEDPALSQDIQETITRSNTAVFNLSLKLLGESAALDNEITTFTDLALFVVAAGNDKAEVCKPGKRTYPACWGDRTNVVVVGGTALDGKTILRESNVGSAIHLVAPAAGYFSAGRQQSYVPVAGTSFATALVTVTAAELFAQGLDNPARIKQRLIATADFDITLPEWAHLLNVRRALSDLDHAVLTDQNGNAKIVDLEARDQQLTFVLARNGQLLPLTVGQIRRLLRDPRSPSRFILAYADTDDRLHIETVRAPNGEWAFSFQPLDDHQMPSGEIQRGDLSEYKDYVGPIK